MSERTSAHDLSVTTITAMLAKVLGEMNPHGRLDYARGLEISVFFFEGAQGAAYVQSDIAQIGTYVEKVMHCSQ